MSALRRLLVGLLARPASLAVIGTVAVSYALLFLWLSGDLAGGGTGRLSVDFPAWARVLERRGPLRFEPVGWVEVGPWVWTFSPLDTLIALGLGGLLGANLAALWQLRRAATACPVGAPSTGLLAGLSALLAGGACCAPLLVIWLGLPIAGGLAALAPWLVPLSCLALLVGLWRLARLQERYERKEARINE